MEMMKRNSIVRTMTAVFCLGTLLGACTSSPPKVVQVTNNGQQMVLQLSRDSRSLLSRIPEKEAVEARLALMKRTDLTPILMSSLAELSLLSGKTEEAATQARALLKKDLKNVDAMKTLIKVSLFVGKPAEALLMANSALQVQARDGEIMNLRGLAHYMQGEQIEARESWKRAIEINPTLLTAQMNLAILYYTNRNLAAAGVGFDKILAQDASHLDAQVGKAVVMAVQGNHVEARLLLAKVMEKIPESPLVLFNLAAIERERFENYEVALQYTEKFLALSDNKERKTLERAVAQREELRQLIAKKKVQKASDAELRQLASRTAQQSVAEVGTDVQQPRVSVTVTAVKVDAKPAVNHVEAANKIGRSDVPPEEASALEEVLKQ